MNDIIYQIALTLLPNVGDITAKKLVSYCGGAEAVFKENKKAFEKIPGIGKAISSKIVQNRSFKKAEEELKFIENHNIKTLFFTEKDYPTRLKQCEDGPVLLYYKGNADLNHKRIISIVGTRSATEYGKEQCRKLVEELSVYNPIIVSGLAYGIDTSSHRSALDYGLKTVGVLGHGLDRLYPSANKKLAKRMQESGGVLTEFMINTKPERENFPKRNRIIAGLSDAVIVVEAADRGGALISAEIANSYNRDVFAVPAKLTDKYSAGCNWLIKTHKAALIQSATDVAYIMRWDANKTKQKEKQLKLLLDLNPEETAIIKILESGESNIDSICLKTNMNLSKIAEALLSLEFEGIVLSLPGKMYRIN